jgi:hypothetical protein
MWAGSGRTAMRQSRRSIEPEQPFILCAATSAQDRREGRKAVVCRCRTPHVAKVKAKTLQAGASGCWHRLPPAQSLLGALVPNGDQAALAALLARASLRKREANSPRST